MYWFPRWKWLWLTFGIVVAFSRVIVTAHYLSDTIAGGWVSMVGFVLVRDVFERKIFVKSVK
jgi:membrane-associated phospholipid phosphatase